MIPLPRSFRSLNDTLAFSELATLQLEVGSSVPHADLFAELATRFAQERNALGLAPNSAQDHESENQIPFVFSWRALNQRQEQFGEEEYELEVSREGVSIYARTARGLFYATRTLLSLAGDEGRLECCSVQDSQKS